MSNLNIAEMARIVESQTGEKFKHPWETDKPPQTQSKEEMYEDIRTRLEAVSRYLDSIGA